MIKEPIRTCIVCRVSRPKKDLMRLTRDEAGLRLDLTTKLSGRGAYVCYNPSCLKGLLRKGILGKSLRIEVDDKEIKEITANLIAQIDRRKDG